MGSLHKQMLTIYCVPSMLESALSETEPAAGLGSQEPGDI